MNGTVVSQGKIRSTDQQYEILFWESIKDSNNLLMYQDYLQKFPNGTFAELARINIQRLSEAEPEKAAKTSMTVEDTSASKMQASVAAPSPKVAPPASQPVAPPVSAASKTKAVLSGQRASLGVFPWKLTGSAPRWDFIALDALVDVLNRHKDQVIARYTYYEIKTKPRPEQLEESFFTKKVVQKLWSGSDGGPNMDYVRRVGKQLDIDVVLMCDIDGRTFDPDSGTYKMYVVDVHSGRVYQGRAYTQNIEGEAEYRFIKLSEKLFGRYIQYAAIPPKAGKADVDTVKKDVQASLTPVVTKSKLEKPDDSRIKLAVFPWKLTGGAARYNFIAIDSLTGVIKEHKNKIVPLYTYYDLEIRPEPTLLGEDFFSKDVVRKLWSGSGDKPNIGYVRDVGKQLDVDAVIICYVYVRVFDPDPGTYKIYIVDVNSGKMYQGRANTQDVEGQGGARFEKLAQRLMAEFIRNR
jgi:cell division protein FtsB